MKTVVKLVVWLFVLVLAAVVVIPLVVLAGLFIWLKLTEEADEEALDLEPDMETIEMDAVEETGTVGNLYVNRSMIGAIVGSQPFGGEGQSGTGPKAGGPHYLPRFCNERVTSTDTTSSGGNATLLSLEDVGF